MTCGLSAIYGGKMKSEYHTKTKQDGRIIEWWGEEVELERMPQKHHAFLKSISKGTDIKLFPFQHREGGPAVIIKNPAGEVIKIGYYIDGEMHRVDGPASSELHKGKWIHEYFLFGIELSNEDAKNFDKPGFVDGFILENS